MGFLWFGKKKKTLEEKTIPTKTESYEEAVEKKEVPFKEAYSHVGHAVGSGRTKQEALERMLKHAGELRADVIYGFRQYHKPFDRHGLTEMCEGQAYVGLSTFSG